MNMPNRLILLGPVIAMTTLGACTSSDNSLEDARYMSCTELARNIGRQEQRKEDALIDGIGDDIDMIISKTDEDKTASAISGMINDLDEHDADQSLKQLNQIFRQKGCV
ncbi:MAG TPA: hypothetical protein DCS30_19800 [Rhizobiales bacterium]|nr:hypothetical protein [Hyphomicrobiales bacterium]